MWSCRLFQVLLAAACVAAWGCEGGSGDGDAFEEPDPDVQAPDAQDCFDAVLKEVKVEAWWYGGVAFRLAISSTTRDVVASWSGVDQCLFQMMYSQSGVGQFEDCKPQWGESRADGCMLLADGSECTISEDRRSCVCTAYWGALNPDIVEGKAFLPPELYLYPSTNLAVLEQMFSTGLRIELPGSDKPVVTYQAEQFPDDFQYLMCTSGTLAVTWAGTDGLSELLAKQYPTHALIYRVENIPITQSAHYDIWKDICYDTVLTGDGGLFSFEINPQIIAGCPTDRDLMFRPVAYRELKLDDKAAAGSFVRYGNGGTAIRITPWGVCEGK